MAIRLARLHPLAGIAVVASVLVGTAACGSREAADDRADVALAEAQPSWQWSDAQVQDAVEAVRAGRELTPVTWPGGARVAVALSFDVDNETLALRTGDTRPGTLSQGEYGARRGLGRVLDVLDAQGVPATFFIPAWSLKLAPQMASDIQASGRHEIGVHGWIHEPNPSLDADTERSLMLRSIAFIAEATGRRPVGYRAPSWNMSPATLALVRESGFLYDSSLMADDQPYELLQQGEPTGVVELPVSWILDDAPLFDPTGIRYSSPRDVLQVWMDEFDRARAEGGLFVLTMHPHYVGRRSRIVVLEELLRHVQLAGGVWFATHREVAEYVWSQVTLP